MLAQVFSGAGIGILLGLLLGLSASPVVALVVGAVAALLSTLVLPVVTRQGGDANLPAVSPQRQREAAWRGAALSLFCVAGLLVGLWLRTHDALSPKPRSLKEQVAEWVDAGFSAEEARRMVVQRALPEARAEPAAAASAARRGTVLFSLPAAVCDKLAPSRYASVSAAAQAYEALGEAELARTARALGKHLKDESQRMAALSAVVEASCAER